MSDVKSLIDVAHFIKDIYKQNSQPRTKYYYLQLCRTYGKRSQNILIYGSYVYGLLYFVFQIMLVMEAFYTGQMVPPRIYFPGIDEKTIGGLSTLIAFNYMVFLCGYVVIISYNLLIFLIFANVPLVSSVITGHMDELTEVLMDPDCHLHEVKCRALTIILMHQKFKE